MLLRLLYLYLITLIPLSLASKTIVVDDQKSFDEMQSSIISAVKSGDLDVDVIIAPGTYLFSSYHLNLSNLNYPNASISIRGNQATVISSVDCHGQKKAPNEYSITYLKDDLSLIDGWSPSFQLSANVEIVDEAKKLCRIQLPTGYKLKKRPQYVNLTKWYLNAIYKVSKVKNNFIYFEVDELKDGHNRLLAKYDINNDYGYGRLHPRCQLYYGTPNGYKYKCINSQFLTMGYSKLKEFSISGLNFLGNAGGGSLLVTNDCKFENMSVNECSFRNIQDVIFYVIKTDNVTFVGNEVTDCNGAVLISENQSRHTRVTNNTISNIGLRMNNVKAVQCVSDDFYISDNTFCNFSYAAIASGLGQNNTKHKCSGVIENNEIYMDTPYYSNASLHTLMDGGAIYIGTVTDGINIRNNHIHDIAGVKDNRGIFCDDGTKNVTIEDNVIQRIQNSYCIDLREVTAVSKKVPDHNTGNTCRNNLTDGDIRFFIKDKTCREEGNTRIGTKGTNSMKAYNN